MVKQSLQPEADAIALENLSARYSGALHDTFSGVELSVPAGGRCLIVGPNGAGKTTLLKRIVGLVQGQGSVRIGDCLLTRSTLGQIRKKVGFVWQNPDDALLLPTVREDIAFGPLNDGLGSHKALEIADEWLARFGIEKLSARYVEDLSLGEKQKVSLAGVLARQPGVLLLDEPTAGLDRQSASWLIDYLKDCPATQLVVAHDLERWQEWSKEALQLQFGKSSEKQVG